MPDADGCTISINLCILIGNTENLPLAASLAYFGINNGFLPVWWQESILSFQGNIYMVDKSNLQQSIIVYLSVIFCYNT